MPRSKPPKAKVRPPLINARTDFDVRAMRKRLKIRQADFWGKVGATQSGGSRYESGRNIPEPVAMLLTLVYGTNAQAKKLLDWLQTPSEKFTD